MRKLTINNSLELISGPGATYLMNDRGFYDLPTGRGSEYIVPQSSRSFFISNYLNPRVVEIDVLISGLSPSDLESKMGDLINNLYASAEEETNFVYTSTAGQEFYFQASVADYEVRSKRGNEARLAFQLVIQDATLLSNFINSVEVPVFGTGGGVILPVVLPITGSTGGNSATATNAGTRDAFPTVTINGPGTNFSITNTTTNQTMTWASSLTGAQSIVIDTRNQSITQNGTSVSQFFSKDNGFMRLAPGINELIFSVASGTNAQTKCTVTWRDVYLTA